MMKYSVLKLLFAFSAVWRISYSCETLPSTVHIVKEIHGEAGQLERTCEGEVAVSKCEGTCISKVRPSAVSHSGFYKDCQCCRESSLRTREVILPKCYDPDGMTLIGKNEKYVLKLREPAECKCYKCGNAPEELNKSYNESS